jgi:hypothetical protein
MSENQRTEDLLLQLSERTARIEAHTETLVRGFHDHIKKFDKMQDRVGTLERKQSRLLVSVTFLTTIITSGILWLMRGIFDNNS